jgi:hypothetical protein
MVSALVLGMRFYWFKSNHPDFFRKVAEWFKVIDCKSISNLLFIGSNPIFSNLL